MLTGILTHYYYLFFIVFLYLVLVVKLLREKKIKELSIYTGIMLGAGVLSLVIFPYSINHMFFGYRGQGVISNFEKFSAMGKNVLEQVCHLNYYGFNQMLYVIVPIMMFAFAYKFIRKKKLDISKEKRDILRIIFIPSSFFFIISAIASTWAVLRYIVSVCGLIFVGVIYLTYELFIACFSEKWVNFIALSLFLIILIAPIALKLEPELLYLENKEIAEKVEDEFNVPTIYFYNTKKAGFINNILLFAKLDESYIAKDIDYTEENVRKILDLKDISKRSFSDY